MALLVDLSGKQTVAGQGWGAMGGSHFFVIGRTYVIFCWLRVLFVGQRPDFIFYIVSM